MKKIELLSNWVYEKMESKSLYLFLLITPLIIIFPLHWALIGKWRFIATYYFVLSILGGSVTYFLTGLIKPGTKHYFSDLDPKEFRYGMTSAIWITMILAYPVVTFISYATLMIFSIYLKVLAYINASIFNADSNLMVFIGFATIFYFLSNHYINIIAKIWVDIANPRVGDKFKPKLKKYSKFYFYVLYAVLYSIIVSDIGVLINYTQSIIEHNTILSFTLKTVDDEMIKYVYNNILKEAMILITIIDVVWDMFLKLNIETQSIATNQD